MTKQTFELNVGSVLAKAAAQRKLDEEPLSVEKTNGDLRAEWAKIGVPLVDRLKEIGRSVRFKKVTELFEAGEDSLLRLGYHRERVTLVLDAAKRATLLHNRALAQIVRVESAIFAGMDPELEKPFFIGCKQSDRVRAELYGIAHADREIEGHLTQCEAHFDVLLASLRTPTAVTSSQPKQAETVFEV